MEHNPAALRSENVGDGRVDVVHVGDVAVMTVSGFEREALIAI